MERMFRRAKRQEAVAQAKGAVAPPKEAEVLRLPEEERATIAAMLEFAEAARRASLAQALELLKQHDPADPKKAASLWGDLVNMVALLHNSDVVPLHNAYEATVRTAARRRGLNLSGGTFDFTFDDLTFTKRV